MENEKIYLFNIICSVLKGSTVLYLMDDLDYSVLFETARKQGLTNFLCEGLKDIFLPEKIVSAQKEVLAAQKTAYRDYNRFLNLLAGKSIPCMPVGGAALRGLYPDPTLRESRDFDILILEKDREEAKILAGKNGFSHVRECEGADYYYKPPATRIALKTKFSGPDLWSKAQKQDGGYIYGLAPADRYIASLYTLKTSLDAGRGQSKLLVDIFVLRFACDHLFDSEYIKNETDRLGLGYFETQIKDMYSALFLDNKDVSFDTELFGKLFADFPKKLPPKYISPEKERLIKKVKKILFITGITLTALTVVLFILLFNNSFGLNPDGGASRETSVESGNVTENESSAPDYISYNNGIYYGETDGELPDGEGRMEYYSGDIYEGEFIKGVREGYGVYYLAAGGRYEGSFVDGAMSGEGTFYYVNGDIVHGAFIDGLPNGSCKFMYANGSVYEGNLVDGVRDGEGSFVYENGDKYVGGFSQGDKSGKGTYTWANGAVFTGEWENNAEVSGKYTDSLGTYEGAFKDGKFFGEGKYTYANGDTYTGAFVNGLEYDNDGVLTYKAGGKYKGAFVNGVFHGAGIMYLPNGDIVTGNFKNGKANGEASYYYANQNITQTVVYKDGEIIEYKSVIK